MNIKQVNPYIHFSGTAEKAIKLYESALGAKTEAIMRYSDVPGMPTPPEQQSLIMHATLRIGQGVVMMSDTPPERAASAGGNVQVSLQFAEVPDIEKAFEALGAGGKVTLPLQDMFWGARFGMLTDAYGVNWMLNCDLKKA
jgi:PhnB protein